MVITPSWQWPTDFKFKIDTEEDLTDIGGAVITVEAGKVLDVAFDTIAIESSQRVTL